VSARYKRSEEHLRRALASIPLGAQTFSKSATHLPAGAAPFFLERGEGALAWDVDGHCYVDFVMGLAALLLGYRDPDVDAAVRAQLERGITFSLSTELEAEVAEALVAMVPCAERVRFGKNGSDATAAAVRLARAATGRDHVAVCGYHGWQDWYIGSTSRDAGVPAATRALTHAFRFGEPGTLEAVLAARPGEVAAVVLEPLAAELPPAGFLEAVRDLARAHGALLVFDETITGLRVARGGAQELFGVTPDLATFGKGLANGLPLSAVVGRADLMRWMEEIFFSTTFGGETLSLAAARAVLAKLRREPVVEALAARGRRLQDGLRGLVARCGLEGAARVSGHPSWSFLQLGGAGSFDAWEVRTFFLQEMLARGILTLGSFNLSYAHGDEHVDGLLAALGEVLPALQQAAEDGSLRERLRAEPLQPLFRVR